jgi:hypothetical protein
VGSRRDCTWILGLPGFRVEMIEGQDEAATSRLRVLHGEVMGLRQDRTEDAARALLTEDLTAGNARPSPPSARTCTGRTSTRSAR